MTISAQALQAIALDAQVLQIHGLAARKRMDDYLAGWPSAPSSTSSSGKENTGLPVDQHRKARDEFEDLCDEIGKTIRRAAVLAMAYGAPVGPSITERINDVETDLWCPHCLKHGHKAVKENGRTQCRWHRDWAEKHPGIDAPSSLVDAHVSGESRAKMGQVYAAWLKANPQVQPRKGKPKASTVAERGTDVETVAGMAERFGGAA